MPTLPTSPRAVLALIIAAGAVALGVAAFAQYVQGYAPCSLCITQRYAWGAAMILAALTLAAPGNVIRWGAVLTLIALLAGAGVAVFHAGIEYGLWRGPQSCATAQTSPDMTLEQLRSALLKTPAVPCDRIAWSLLGLSMAAWNALFSFAMAAIMVVAFPRNRRSPTP